MTRMLLALLAASLAIPGAFMASGHTASAEEDLVHIAAQVSYDIRPDEGPVRVSWTIRFENNDPETEYGDGTVFFYENLSVPVLRGASEITATSPEGTPLSVSLQETGSSPAVSAVVSFERAVFYGENYSFTLQYALSEVRQPSVVVTPVYAYLPVIAGGDEAAVTVNTPNGNGWSVTVEPGDCSQNGPTFSCSGSDAAFVAALAEVSRPDAMAHLPFDVSIARGKVAVDFSYFVGEEERAAHLQQLVTQGLPIIEQLYGFDYPGPPSVRMAQGGRQAVLGYEGLTSCGAGPCQIFISPVADDVAVLHELSHLWSRVYAQRWLSEGFAQMIAEDAAASFPGGFIQGPASTRQPSGADLRLDDWGEVTSIIAAAESELDLENAGYDRSLKFMRELQARIGSEALRRANGTLAISRTTADSERYLDVLEENSGQVLDDLFAEWVFPPSMQPTLEQRRLARDRLHALEQAAAAAGLSNEVPGLIRSAVEDWRFDAALARLDRAEAQLREYQGLILQHTSLAIKAHEAGLSMPDAIRRAIARWDFSSAVRLMAQASEAADAYITARGRVDDPGNVWQQLAGSDSNDDLEAAREAFARGDFDSALEHAQDAMSADSPWGKIALAMLGLIAVIAAIAAAAAVIAWMSRDQERELGPGI